MKWRTIELAILACVLVGCSAANDTARDNPSSSVTASTAASSVIGQPTAGFTIVGWTADGRMFQLGGNVPEKELLALAAGVRPATADDWSRLAI